MKLNPYLLFNGQCEEAFKFYARVLGGKIEAMMTHGETPAAKHAPPEWQKKVLHAALRVDDELLMGSDPAPGYYEQPRGFNVALDISNREKAERVFRELSEGGQVKMPFQQTFWADGFGMFVDRFGIPWLVNCVTTHSGGSSSDAGSKARREEVHANGD